ncbi:MAG: hypothetical protein RIR26_262 [Pseudomonadota bacterium]
MKNSFRLLSWMGPLAWICVGTASDAGAAVSEFIKFKDENSLNAFVQQHSQAQRLHRGLLWVEWKSSDSMEFSQLEAASLGIVRRENSAVSYSIPKPQPVVFPSAETPDSKLWGINIIGAPQAWEVTQGSNDVIVAVVDTGIDYNHPALKDNMWVNAAEAAGQAGVDDDGNGIVDDIYGADFISGHATPLDDEGHGSHVAGTIAGSLPANNFYGVAPRARLMAVKTHNTRGEGSKISVVKGILYAADMGARVLNCSWGGAPEAGAYDQLLFDAIEYANKKGAVLVAAAGNESANNDQGPHFPANYDLAGIISVAASDKLDRRANFSNYGANSVDLAAPGLGIFSVAAGGKGYTYLSGTSMATPHVAGAVALLASTAAGRSLSAGEIRDSLMANVEKLGEWRTRTISGGRLDLKFLSRFGKR